MVDNNPGGSSSIQIINPKGESNDNDQIPANLIYISNIFEIC